LPILSYASFLFFVTYDHIWPIFHTFSIVLLLLLLSSSPPQQPPPSPPPSSSTSSSLLLEGDGQLIHELNNFKLTESSAIILIKGLKTLSLLPLLLVLCG
jgi:hypothetical protein